MTRHPLLQTILAALSVVIADGVQAQSGDWIAWRGTSLSHGYSALDQVNRDTVGDLRLAWAWAIEEGISQPAPIVRDGVMYLTGPGGIVRALDAATGDVQWEYRHRVGGPLANAMRGPAGTTRGVGVDGDKVFLAAPDARLVALEAATGAVVWETEVASVDDGFRFNATPVIARGVVIVGLNGCRKFIEEKCAITGHDAETGERLWRIPTIPGADDPGGDTWDDLAPIYRGGTGMWLTGSYDPDLNLVYWATSQAKPWARVSRGTDGDALFSNTTLAFRPETGEMVWYRQTIRGETHDLDEAYESILVDRDSRQSLFKMGKIGILWELNRETGEVVGATDLGYQNLVDLDRSTFEVQYRLDKIPQLGEPVDQCPGNLGFRNWPSIAFSPETDAFYIPVMMACAHHRYVPVELVPGGGGFGDGGSRSYFHPDTDEQLGRLVALSASGDRLWEHSQRAAFTTAALTTAGGVVFIGDADRYIRAFDTATGDVLWETRAQAGGQGFPMTYSAGGRQFIAVPVGGGAILPGATHVELTPELTRPTGGNALMVFALPD